MFELGNDANGGDCNEEVTGGGAFWAPNWASGTEEVHLVESGAVAPSGGAMVLKVVFDAFALETRLTFALLLLFLLNEPVCDFKSVVGLAKIESPLRALLSKGTPD